MHWKTRVRSGTNKTAEEVREKIKKQKEREKERKKEKAYCPIMAVLSVGWKNPNPT